MEISDGNRDDIDAYDAWTDEQLAAWDPEGDPGRRHLLNPTIFSMLGDVADQRVLDAGCGQGYLSRLLADRGARVTGVEPSSRLLGHAQRLERDEPRGIDYVRADLSRLPATVRDFDAVVANMVFLDIADWQPALAGCVEALRPGGRLVFSVLHPCWPVDAMSSWAARGAVEITEYLQPHDVAVASGTNHHRPMSAYLDHARALGCRIEALAEPLPPEGADLPEICRHIPNYLVVSLVRTVLG